MDPYKIASQELIEKGIYIEIPEEITFEDYTKIYGGFGEEGITRLGVGIPDKTYFYSPESLNRLFQRYTNLVEVIVEKKIDNLRLKFENFILTEKQKKEFTNDLIEKHSEAYLKRDTEFEDYLIEAFKKNAGENSVELEIDKDIEISAPNLEDMLSRFDFDESYSYQMYFDESKLKDWMADEDDLRYYLIKNEYGNLDDYELMSSRFYDTIYQIKLDKAVLSFVKEVLNVESGIIKVIRDTIEEKQEKETVKPKRRIMLLNELGIIDHIDKYCTLGRSYNKIGTILVELFDLDVTADTIRTYIEAIKKPSTTNKHNNPYNNNSHCLWLESKLVELKLPKMG